MKNITKAQTDAVLKLLQKYNVGVQEYSAVVNMFEGLPEVKENNEDTKKEDKGGADATN